MDELEIELCDNTVRIWCVCGRDILHFKHDGRAMCDFCERVYKVEIKLEAQEILKVE